MEVMGYLHDPEKLSLVLSGRDYVVNDVMQDEKLINDRLVADAALHTGNAPSRAELLLRRRRGPVGVPRYRHTVRAGAVFRHYTDRQYETSARRLARLRYQHARARFLTRRYL